MDVIDISSPVTVSACACGCVPSLVLCIALTSPSFLLSLWNQNVSTNRRAEVRSFVFFACFASVPFLRRPSLNQNHVPTTAPTAPATWRAYRTFSATPCSTSTGSCDSPPLYFSLFLSRIHNTCLFPEPGPRNLHFGSALDGIDLPADPVDLTKDSVDLAMEAVDLAMDAVGKSEQVHYFPSCFF